MRRIPLEQAPYDQQEVQRRILESIQPDRREYGGSGLGGTGRGAKRPCCGAGETRRAQAGERPARELKRRDPRGAKTVDSVGRRTAGAEAESALQRHLRRQCMGLTLVAVALLTILVFQMGRGKGTWAASGGKSRVVTAQKRTPFSRDVPSSGQEDLLVLVNKDHALPEGYEVEEHWLNNGRESVSDRMYGALRDMLTAGSEDGRAFVVASGYRSAEYQRQLLEEDIEKAMREQGLTYQEAYDQESLETMPAGHSEHETGLAVDLVSLDYQVLDGAQEYTPENRWLREHCAEYGFILRYPADKEEITGITYEPWHFRYVGEEAAREITSRGITLEEYLGEA